MKYDVFVGQVQHRAQLPTRERAVGAIRATLTTLAQRLFASEARDLAAQLPREIGYYLVNCSTPVERFSPSEFIARVAEAEDTTLKEATYHIRVVLEVLQEAVSKGEIEDVLADLPKEFQPLFNGSNGRLQS